MTIPEEKYHGFAEEGGHTGQFPDLTPLVSVIIPCFNAAICATQNAVTSSFENLYNVNIIVNIFFSCLAVFIVAIILFLLRNYFKTFL